MKEVVAMLKTKIKHLKKITPLLKTHLNPGFLTRSQMTAIKTHALIPRGTLSHNVKGEKNNPASVPLSRPTLNVNVVHSGGRDPSSIQVL